jgi:hypothetical protein
MENFKDNAGQEHFLGGKIAAVVLSVLLFKGPSHVKYST